MGKRKLDEFLELAKDLSASEIAESLSTLGPVKFRRILSDPKLKHDMKGLEARTIGQLYCAFQYFLKQRKWDINTGTEEQELWAATMHILNTPHRTQVKFLARAPFLRAFEHAMLLAHQTQALRKEEDNSTDEVTKGLRLPGYPRQVDGYQREHPFYHEKLISYEEWLKTEDMEFDDEVEKWNAKVRQRFLGVANIAELPAIAGPESGRQRLSQALLANGNAIDDSES